MNNAAATAVNLLDGGGGQRHAAGRRRHRHCARRRAAPTYCAGTGAGSTWTLNGGADNDTIYLGNLYFSQEDGPRSRPAVTGADRFYVHTASNGAERDRITDFNAAEGDLIELDSVANGRTAANGWWPIGNASLIFRGAMDPAYFVYGAALPGADVGTGFVQLWTVQTGATRTLSPTATAIWCSTIPTWWSASMASSPSPPQASLPTASQGCSARPATTRSSARPGADVIYGIGGNDTISGGNSNDELHGGIGNDTLYGEVGSRHALR
jgi:Ca2+-binding RTX toxin-like protein